MKIPEKLEPPASAGETLTSAFTALATSKTDAAYAVTLARRLLDKPEDRTARLKAANEKWQDNSLLPFTALAIKEGEAALTKAKAALAAFETSVLTRRERLGAGLGGLLHDADAGRDLATLIIRVAGGYIDPSEPHSRFDATSSVSRWAGFVGAAETVTGEIAASRLRPPSGKAAQRESRQSLLGVLENEGEQS